MTLPNDPTAWPGPKRISLSKCDAWFHDLPEELLVQTMLTCFVCMTTPPFFRAEMACAILCKDATLGRMMFCRVRWRWHHIHVSTSSQLRSYHRKGFWGLCAW